MLKEDAVEQYFTVSVMLHTCGFVNIMYRVSMQSSTPTHTRTHFSIQPGNEFYYSGYC